MADSNSDSLFVHYIEQLMFVRIVILLDWIVLIYLTMKGKNIRKIFGTDMFGAGNLRYQTSVGNRIRATSQQGTYLASARWPSFSCGVATEAAATARPCVLAAPHHPCPGMWAPGRCSTLYRPHWNRKIKNVVKMWIDRVCSRIAAHDCRTFNPLYK